MRRAMGHRAATGTGNGRAWRVGRARPAGGVVWRPLVDAEPSSFADGYVPSSATGAALDDQWLLTPETASSVTDWRPRFHRLHLPTDHDLGNLAIAAGLGGYTPAASLTRPTGPEQWGRRR